MSEFKEIAARQAELIEKSKQALHDWLDEFYPEFANEILRKVLCERINDERFKPGRRDINAIHIALAKFLDKRINGENW